ncbi:MAG: hypothetical protein BMS9Abin17_0065 [Acidimicrobiia bacterium]|nr:MAG: hypothetical protein BMS9Abin17_0065 [Acidimicrobiia bacterium]
MTKLLDPVCGMTVDDTSFLAPGYDDVAFCAPGCRTTFLRDPAAYPNRMGSAAPTTMIPTAPTNDSAACQCDHNAADLSHGH